MRIKVSVENLLDIFKKIILLVIFNNYMVAVEDVFLNKLMFIIHIIRIPGGIIMLFISGELNITETTQTLLLIKV